MTTCINCGNQNSAYLCENCRQIVDIEKLCSDIMAYNPGNGVNSLWNKIAAALNEPYNFKNIVFALADELPSPRKEYVKIIALSENKINVPKRSYSWLYETAECCLYADALTEYEQNRIKCLVLNAYSNTYQYDKAEELAKELVTCEKIPLQVSLSLGQYYERTRRYDKAEQVLLQVKSHAGGDQETLALIENQLNSNERRRQASMTGKKEYMPNPNSNRQGIQAKYVAFLNSIGIEAAMPVPGKKAPEPIPRDEYPAPVETRDTDFDTFVAFDLETTGRSATKDCIIEIGAIKVINGQIVDSQEFLFQELVKPFKKRVHDDVVELTGITQKDVEHAREMWEVFPDFMKFVEDAVLVGFNCISFDSKFLVRAGRYSHLVPDNKYFDVMRYADKFKERLGIEGRGVNLASLCEKLDIENPRAHRALADAITTANVYLKLKAMEEPEEVQNIDDVLADLDDW